MSNYTDQDRALALIGVYQVSKLVFDLATTGKVDKLAYQTCLNSLFASNPENTLGVYGGEVANIQTGVRTLLAQMKSQQASEQRNMEITRYALSLILLERSVNKADGAMENIAKILETAQKQQAHFGELHENVIASIARAYTENVSQYNPRIMVKGQHGHLQNPQNANKIRALLLAGIRSALLWRQVGGSRWGLLLKRKNYLRAAQALYRPDSDSDSESFFKPD